MDVFDTGEDNTASILKKVKKGSLVDVKLKHIRGKVENVPPERSGEDIVQVQLVGRQNEYYKFKFDGSEKICLIKYSYLENSDSYLRNLPRERPQVVEPPQRDANVVNEAEGNDDEVLSDDDDVDPNDVGNGRRRRGDLIDREIREIGDAMVVVDLIQRDDDDNPDGYEDPDADNPRQPLSFAASDIVPSTVTWQRNDDLNHEPVHPNLSPPELNTNSVPFAPVIPGIPTVPQDINVRLDMPSWYFFIAMPMSLASLLCRYSSYDALTYTLLYQFFGMLIHMASIVPRSKDDVWDMVAVPAKRLMPQRRFDKIFNSLRFCAPDILKKDDNKYEHIQPLIDTFNGYYKTIITSVRAFCADESMIPWTGFSWLPYHITKSKNKPTPVGFLWRTLAEVNTRLIMVIYPQREAGVAKQEMIEDTTLPFRIKQVTTFVTAKMAYLAGLIRAIPQNIYIVGDSWFSSVYTAVVLKALNINYIGVVKKGSKQFPVAKLKAIPLEDNATCTYTATVPALDGALNTSDTTLIATVWNDTYTKPVANRAAPARAPSPPRPAVVRPRPPAAPRRRARRRQRRHPPEEASSDDEEEEEPQPNVARVQNRPQRGPALALNAARELVRHIRTRRMFIHTMSNTTMLETGADVRTKRFRKRKMLGSLYTYYTSAGAVDQANQVRSYTLVDNIRTKEWYIRVFLGVFNMILANAYALYSFDYDSQVKAKLRIASKKLTIVKFMRAVAAQLLIEPFSLVKKSFTDSNPSAIDTHDKHEIVDVSEVSSAGNPRRTCDICGKETRAVCTKCIEEGSYLGVCKVIGNRDSCLNRHLRGERVLSHASKGVRRTALKRELANVRRSSAADVVDGQADAQAVVEDASSDEEEEEQ